MRKDFKITGYFYQIGKWSCRKYLNIQNKDSKRLKPDLMVVMMNPGKSKPINEIDNGNEETETIPDRTQDQIMRVMQNCGFEFARILNLSDLRITPSGAFYQQIPILKQKGIPHSIFDGNRKNEFDELYVRNIPVIIAWGVAPELRELAKKAKQKIEKENWIGINKKNEEFAFYHPLPRNNNDQIKWVTEITNRIKTA